MAHLDSLTQGQLRREVLRALAEATQASTFVTRENLLWRVLSHSREHLGLQPDDVAVIRDRLQKSYGEFRVDAQTRDQTKGESEDVVRIEAILWELVARGLAYPRFNAVNPTRPDDGWPYVIEHLVVTPRGREFFKRQNASPYHDDWVRAVCDPLPDLPDDIARRLQDARDCLLAHVLRPAVIMAGLACERVVASVYDHCNLGAKVPARLAPGNRPSAKRLLDGVVEMASKLRPRPEGIESLALQLTELVRQDRNIAGHGWTREFDDAEEVELLLLAASRSISTLWSLRGRL